MKKRLMRSSLLNMMKEFMKSSWRTDGAKQRSERGKLNRKGMTLFHTTGSKSHACVIDEEHKKNGYPPRRDEAFVITHTSKTGVPSNKAAAQKIERNGYVRCIGLGPNAADLRMPVTRKLKSTKLQMAEEECQQAMQDTALLRERVEETDRKVDILMNEILEIKKMMLASQDKENEQFTPQYASNSALNEDFNDEVETSEAGYVDAEDQNDHVMSNRPMLGNRAEITQQKKQMMVQQENQLELQNTIVAQKTPQVGHDVMLYSIARPYNVPVAKATIQSIDRAKIVAGAELGSQCCEVVVNMVMKKDAILQRPYGNMEVVRKVPQKQPSQPVVVPTSRRWLWYETKIW